MTEYLSPNETNIKAYEIGDDYIIVEFASGSERFYKYTYSTTGKGIVEELKRLATSGNGGLNSALHRSKGIKYAKKW